MSLSHSSPDCTGSCCSGSTAFSWSRADADTTGASPAGLSAPGRAPGAALRTPGAGGEPVEGKKHPPAPVPRRFCAAAGFDKGGVARFGGLVLLPALPGTYKLTGFGKNLRNLTSMAKPKAGLGAGRLGVASARLRTPYGMPTKRGGRREAATVRKVWERRERYALAMAAA